MKMNEENFDDIAKSIIEKLAEQYVATNKPITRGNIIVTSMEITGLDVNRGRMYADRIERQFKDTLSGLGYKPLMPC